MLHFFEIHQIAHVESIEKIIDKYLLWVYSVFIPIQGIACGAGVVPKLLSASEHKVILCGLD